MNVVGDFSKARFLAAFIDTLLAFGLMLIVVGVVPETFLTLRGILVVTGYLGYSIVLEGLWSRTVGKYFQGLIVRKLDGSPSDWKDAFIRGILRVVEFNPALLGGLPAGLLIMSSEKKQRLGDMIAGTVVVSDKLKWEQEIADTETSG